MLHRVNYFLSLGLFGHRQELKDLFRKSAGGLRKYFLKLNCFQGLCHRKFTFIDILTSFDIVNCCFSREEGFLNWGFESCLDFEKMLLLNLMFFQFKRLLEYVRDKDLIYYLYYPRLFNF